MAVYKDGTYYVGDSRPNVIRANNGDNIMTGGKGDDRLLGLGGIDLIGGERGADTIDGGRGNDVMSGGLGLDTLIGGQGQDFFVFDSKPGPANIDVIVDFSPHHDTIWLDRTIFKGIGASDTLARKAFVLGDKALDRHDRIIYDPATGALSYDPDGTGAKAAVTFAQLNPGLKMTSKDFFIT
jgi:Ca2+-binding RTX toxin-like protein